MALLKFSRGEFKALPTTKTEGHVYITTDEKAMYVDISNSERIRIGQIITLSAQEWTNLQPPYSTEAFYYIGGDYNALLKWTGSAWVQINSTKAVQDQFTALSNKIANLDTHLGVTRNTADGSVISSTIKTDVTNLLATVGGENSGLVADVNTLETKVGTLERTVGSSTSGLVKDVATLKANTVQKIQIGENGTVKTPTDNKVVLGALAGVDKVSKSNIDTAFENRLGAMETGIGNNAVALENVYTKDYINNTVNTINGNITTNANGIKDINDKIGTTEIEKSTLTATIADNTSRIDSLETHMSTAEGAIIQLQTDVETAQAQADKGVADAKTAQAKADEALARSGGTMTGDITMSTGKRVILPDAPGGDTHAANRKYVDDTVNEAKRVLQGAIDGVSAVATEANNRSIDNLNALNDANTGLAAAHTTAKQGIADAKKAQEDVDALEKLVGAGFGADTTLTAKITAIEEVNTTQGTAITELQEKVKNVSNVMNFRGVVTSVPANGASGYQYGDVVVVVNEDSRDNGKEFVYDETKWHEFGNSNATSSAIGELGERLDVVEGAINDNGGILTRLTAVENKNTAQDTNIQNIIDQLTWGRF